MEGCDLFCSFCIVPRTRGREISRPAAAILAEARQWARRGVRELTLLGQTVNAYGRRAGRQGPSGEEALLPFARLVREIAAIPGVERVRYTSPHPRFFDAELLCAHAELPELCPHVHLPLQSGSDAVLARMRRRYTRDEFLRLTEQLRRAREDLALTTDLIVGFPGESAADFEATLSLVREVGFVDGYSFKYSPRPGTAAAKFPGAVPPEVAQQRLEILQALLRRQTLAAHRQRVGSRTEVLVEGSSRRDRQQPERTPGQLQGRDPYHRVVNFSMPPGIGSPRVGDLVEVELVEATPHSLIGVPVGGAAVKSGGRPADEPEAVPAAP